MEIFKGVKKKHRGNKKARQYRYEFKLRVVKLYLEEGVPVSLIHKETGVAKETLWRWIRVYKAKGEEGLKTHQQVKRGGERMPASVKEKIIEVKKEHPAYGVRRISQVLRRLFFLPASPESIRRTLHQESLISPPKKRSRRNISKPRFFERSIPNQMWQADIFTFRLGGKNAYLIGYLDDYSRYITGLELFRSQTADNVIEVYRRASSEYNPPKEMLTDNGRQYTNWRGTSRFEAEVKKDRVHHIKSRPHHPMTLGKIERFWKTIFVEFLGRAQFESFESARERVRLWVSYYNHKRPHQGIGGLCPADRYFEIQTELRQTIEKGIQENILEMALRGRPKSPFYMVGRMEGQSVVLRAEKGKLRLLVDDEGGQESQEVVYNLDKESNNKEVEGNEREEQGRREGEEGRESTEEGEGFRAQCVGEVQGGVVDLAGAEEAFGGKSGVLGSVCGDQSLAEPSVGGDAAGVGAEGKVGERVGIESEVAGIVGEEETERGRGKPVGGEVGEDPRGAEGGEEDVIGKRGDGFESGGEEGGEGERACPGHYGSAQRPAHGHGGGEAVGGISEDLLRMGAEGVGGDGEGDSGSGGRATSSGGGSGEGGVEGAGAEAGAGGRVSQEDGCSAEDAESLRGEEEAEGESR